MEILIFFIIIVAIALVIWGAMIYMKNASLSLPKEIFEVKAPKRKFKIKIDFSRILPTRGFLESTKMFDRIKKSLDAAHVSMTPDAFFNVKIMICVFLAVVITIVIHRIDPILIIICIIIGYIFPDFYLKRRLTKRKYLIARGLPEAVDLLGLCIEAGLDFVSAVKWIIDKTPHTPIIEELAFVLEEIKWGKPRVVALKDMSRRLNIREISSFVQTIILAERMGTPVAEAFGMLSEDARAQRFHRGERTALKAPIKILLPLIFFIMPVIGIVIGGPIMLQFMQGGIGAGLK